MLKDTPNYQVLHVICAPSMRDFICQALVVELPDSLAHMLGHGIRMYNAGLSAYFALDKTNAELFIVVGDINSEKSGMGLNAPFLAVDMCETYKDFVLDALSSGKWAFGISCNELSYLWYVEDGVISHGQAWKLITPADEHSATLCEAIPITDIPSYAM